MYFPQLSGHGTRKWIIAFGTVPAVKNINSHRAEFHCSFIQFIVFKKGTSVLAVRKTKGCAEHWIISIMFFFIENVSFNSPLTDKDGNI